MPDEITTVPCRSCSVLAHWECTEDQCPCALAGHTEPLPDEPTPEELLMRWGGALA